MWQGHWDSYTTKEGRKGSSACCWVNVSFMNESSPLPESLKSVIEKEDSCEKTQDGWLVQAHVDWPPTQPCLESKLDSSQ